MKVLFSGGSGAEDLWMRVPLKCFLSTHSKDSKHTYFYKQWSMISIMTFRGGDGEIRVSSCDSYSFLLNDVWIKTLCGDGENILEVLEHRAEILNELREAEAEKITITLRFDILIYRAGDPELHVFGPWSWSRLNKKNGLYIWFFTFL